MSVGLRHSATYWQGATGAKVWDLEAREPHHMLRLHGKDRIVFNCFFQDNGQSINDILLPGPTFGPISARHPHLIQLVSCCSERWHQGHVPPDTPLARQQTIRALHLAKYAGNRGAKHLRVAGLVIWNHKQYLLCHLNPPAAHPRWRWTQQQPCYVYWAFYVCKSF